MTGRLVTGHASRTAELRELVCDRVDERVSLAHFRRLGDAWVSSIGVTAEAFTAGDLDFKRALHLGFNLFEVGIDADPARTAFRTALHGGEGPQASRSQAFVVARGGVIGGLQGLPLGVQLDRIESELVRPGVITLDDFVDFHCIEGRYLEREVERARVDVGVETIDVYLLDRPDRVLRRRPVRERESRLSRAFASLEGLVERHAIGCYGLAMDAASEDEITPESALNIARGVAATISPLSMFRPPSAHSIRARGRACKASR